MSTLYTETETPLQKFVVVLDTENEDRPEIMDVQISDLGIMFEEFIGSEYTPSNEDELIGSLSVTWRDLCSYLEARKIVEENT